MNENKPLKVSRKIRRLLKRIRPNRNIKDVLFRYIFQDKEKLLELYNALNHSHYTSSEELRIVTFENIIYMTMKEDTAFIIANTMNLFEHQSSINLNMPVRGLIYFAKQYEMLLREMDANIYGKKLIMLPTPRYVVFYNGTEDSPDKSELRLSDAFIVKDERPTLEVIATMLNINFNHNMELLNRCKPLYEYSYFINKIREYQEEKDSFEDAVDRAVDYCIAHDILRDILKEHSGEVRKMLLTEYDPKKHIRQEREEAREEGRSEGIEIGTLRGRSEGIEIGTLRGRSEGIEIGTRLGRNEGIETLITICQEYQLPREDIACRLREKYGITEEQAKEYMDQFWK